MAQNESVEEARRQAEEVVHQARPWVSRVARAGYVAKGTVYATVGVLAGQAALGTGGKTTGTGGAVSSIGSQPLGKILLVLLTLGLVGYAFWKIVQGVMDPDEKGSDLTGIVRRVAYGGSALIHLAIAFSALEEILGPEGHSTTLDQRTGMAMSYQPPLGQILVGLAGLGVICVGLYQLYAGVTGSFRDDLKTHEMSEAGRWTLLTGRVGTSARAVVILVAGFFVVLAAWQADPSETRGFGDTLKTITQQPFGSYLLGGVALGLLAYAAFMLVVAHYRNIEAS